MPAIDRFGMEEKKEREGAEVAEEEEEDGKQTVTAYVAVPPDGGWGWVIVAASFACNFVVDGIVFSYGVFTHDIKKAFPDASEPQINLAGSLLSGVYMLAGPFVSAVANRYGFRTVAILGSIIGTLSLIISTYAPSIQFLWFSYGILGGIGFGMIYVPAVIACGFYFEKWRALATGISVCGSGIGTIVMGPLCEKLLANYGLKTTFYIQAGIVASCMAFGALFRPLKPLEVEVPNPDKAEDDPTKLPLMQRIKIARDQLRRADSAVSIENEVSIAAVPPTETKRFLKANHNAMYPTAAEVLYNSSNSLAKSRHSICSNHRHNSEKRVSIVGEPTRVDGNHNPGEEEEANHDAEEVHLMQKKHSKTAIVEGGGRRDSITLKYRTRTMSESSRGSRSRRNTLSRQDTTGVRPLYRDDIFLQGSLTRLPQFTSHASGLDYTMSVSRLPTWKDVQEEEESKCTLCPEAVRRTLATMLDFSLLSSYTFLLLSLGGFITMMGLFVPFIYTPSRAESYGHTAEDGVYIMASIGITNTIGRIICGAMSSLPGANSLLINNIALTVGGLAVMVSNFSGNLYFQYAYALVFGFSIACFASLRSIIIVDLIGLENLTNAFGLLLLFQGVAAIIGSPIAGAFQESTGSYEASFYLAGGLICLSGILCYPLNWLNQWEKKKSAQKEGPDQKNDTTVV